MTDLEKHLYPIQKETIGKNIDFMKVMYSKIKDEMEYDDLLLIGDKVNNLLDKMDEIFLDLGIDDGFINIDMD